MSSHATLARGLGTVLLALLLSTLPTGCNGGLFRSLMEGKNGSALAGSLKISPASASVVAGTSLKLAAAGGDGNYTFKVIGTGTFDAATTTYTAPAQACADKVQVSDGAGTMAEAVISVRLNPAPDYRVAVAPAPTFPGPGAGGSAFAGTFRIENISTEAGAASIGWKVYISRDTTLDSLDLLAASGTQVALGAASASADIAFSGTWPVAAIYYLIIALTAADDGDASNNQTCSPAIAVSGGTLAPPDYSVVSIGIPTSPQTLSSFSGQTLTIKNGAAGNGYFPIGWQVFLSTNATLDAGDQLVASGTIPALASGATGTATFSGSFPALAGSYYFIAKVTSYDDAATGTKVLASSPISVIGPKYKITAVSNPNNGTTGLAIAGTLTFTVANQGSGNGNSSIAWSVYASTDTTLSAGDLLIASGSIPALAAGASTIPSYSGTWPSVAGSYYIIASVQAADDGNGAAITNSASVAVSAPASPDYKVVFSLIPWSGRAGAPLTGTAEITITNTNGNPGHSPIFWTIYSSTDQVLDGFDISIASGSTSTLGAIQFPASWPALPGGFFYLIATINALDDSNVANNIVVASHPTAVGDYVYVEGPEINDGHQIGAVAPIPSATSATGINLNPGQSLAIEGTMEAMGAYDTYAFGILGSFTKIGVQARWKTGYDDIDLFLWKDTGLIIDAASQDHSVDSEPFQGTYKYSTTLTGTWYIGALLYLNGGAEIPSSVGQKYAILVTALP